MKKIIFLILLTALVGCAEYSSYDECIVKETAKIQYRPTNEIERRIHNYCVEFSKK